MGNFDRTRWFYSVFKMDVTIWLSVLLAVITLGTPAASSEPRVVCYYTNWSVYRPGTARFNPQNINPYLCTHLVYAFGGFTKDNSLKPFDKYQDIEKGGYAKFTGLKTYNKNLKTLLAIGGWNEGSSRFSPMVASRERRKEFVRNAIKFLRQNRFDGLDLDWEYPAFRDGGKPKDREHYAKLVRELREEFENESEKTGKPRLLLTMAVPAGIEYIQKGFDVKSLNRYLDWMNLLTYDYHSAFEPAVNHHAPLYPYEEPNEYSVDSELNIDYTIKFYLEQGADPDKLVLGIPTYGRSYTLFNPDAVELGSPADGPGEQGDATREKGYLAYYEICEALKPKKPKKRSPSSDEDSEEYEDEKEEQPWTVMYPNSAAMGPVAYRGNQWVGYDDEDIVRKKAEYVAEKQLGGIMFWSIDNDDFRGTCHGKPYPLIEAAKEAYYAKLGSTINTVAQTTRTPITRPSNRRKTRPTPTSTRATPSTTRTTTTTTTTRKPTTASSASNRVTSTTPAWTINTPEPPTTPDPGADFKCVDEGFYPHPRDCKKYFWCLDSGPSNLGIVAHQFTCPSGLYFNKAADSCDFARNVLCKKPAATTKATTVKPPSTTTSTTTTTAATTRKAFLSTKNSVLFRTTSSTTTTTPQPASEEDFEEDPTDEDSEDPKVIKELIDLIRKVGGIEQLEKQFHLGESSSSTGGVMTTTPSSFNKVLYQKVLERTRGRNKNTGNNIIETLTQTVKTGQNNRRGPQNAGLEESADKDKPSRRDRPQYVTINRQRGSTTTTAVPEDSEEDYEEEEEEVKVKQTFRNKAVFQNEVQQNVATTAKTLQYVNIRRGRPNTATTSDTADDTASRNALFERQEPLVAISETSNAVEALSSRRETKPEYVTIRRQRPTTEETTTQQYQESDEVDEEEPTLLEKELSSRPKYNTIVRSTTVSPEEPSTRSPLFKIYTLQTDAPDGPDPTTVLAVQISSLLNSPTVVDIESAEIETPVPVTEEEPTTTTTTSPTTTTQALPPKRTITPRRRGSTIKTTAAPTSVTQVSPRNYTTVIRQRPLRRPNEITPDSNDVNNLFRKIRSTTPDSREISEVKEVEGRRNRFRFQSKPIRPDDSVPAEASPIEDVNDGAQISLPPADIQPQFVPRQRFNTRTDRRFRRPLTSSTVADTTLDSEVSAANVEVRRPGLVPRGRSRFTLSSTTDATIQTSTTAILTPRRPTFARLSPRPFTRPSSTTPADISEDVTLEAVTQRSTLRSPFGRTRPLPAVSARKLPFVPRQSTTQQTLVDIDNDDDELDTRPDDISLSESAREEKEHDEPESEIEEDVPRRKVIIKKLRAPGSTDDLNISTETVPIDADTNDTGRKRFRVIRRRPTSTTTSEPFISSEAPTGSGLHRVRKVIRKKLRPSEFEPETSTKTVDYRYSFQSSTYEVFNYGEKTKPPYTTKAIEVETEPIIEQVTEFYKEHEGTDERNVEPHIEPDVEEHVTKKVIELSEEKQTDNIIVQTTVTPYNNVDLAQSNNATIQSINNNINIVQSDTTSNNNVDVQSNIKIADNADTVIEQNNNEHDASSNKDTKSEEEIGEIISSEGINKNEPNSNGQTETKVEVAIATENEGIDVSLNKESGSSDAAVTETEAPETTTTSTTLSTTATSRTRLPYRPRKKLYTPSTEPSVPSTSKTFSRKYNPGVYTSPATVTKVGGAVTRRPFSSRVFTRRPFTPKTTQRVEEDEEYSEEISEVSEEHEQENPFVFVPSNQLFTRKPDSTEEDDETANSEEIFEEGEGDENNEDEEEQGTFKFGETTRKPGFKPRVVNSNTFRTSTTTTELPKRLATSQNRTSVINRFGGNKPVIDKKRVQNVPSGYNSTVVAVKSKDETTVVKTESQSLENSGIKTTTANSETESETTTLDDDYLTDTAVTDGKEIAIDVSTVNSIETETATEQMEIDDSTNDYLEFIEGTTNYPTTQDIVTSTQTEPEHKTTIIQNIITNTIPNTEATIEQFTTSSTTTTTVAPPVSPIIRTQFNKLFSVSRVVEVNSKLDKHRLNKNNGTTLIEEGKIMIEKKPVLDKIGEVSRYSLIKIVEDEIPIYLTKFGHVYPVEHPPDNIIRIDEARNARALNENAPEVPKENLVASESVNEAYRHIKEIIKSNDKDSKSHIEYVPNDQFLTYINDDNKNNKDSGNSFFSQWQFVPAAYENEKIRAAKSFEIITPRTLLTNPSTLPLEGLFKTENPFMARKASDNDKKVGDEKHQPFIVYSDVALNQQDDVNIDKLSVLPPETARSIITFAKGQEFNGGTVTEETKAKDFINGPVYINPNTDSTLSTSTATSGVMSLTTTPTVTTTTQKASSPILDLLSTTLSTVDVTSTSTTISPETTETATEDTTTTKISPIDAKRARFGFPRRPIIKSTNFTRPTVTQRTVKKINVTAINLNQKSNRTAFSPSKSRFSANRVQNVPVDLKKKSSTPKIVPKTFSTSKVYTTEIPKTTTEKKYIKPIRPSFRPSFFPRKTTQTPTTGDT